MTTTMLRPGILVALHSSVTGGVNYQRVDLENSGCTTKWETTKTVEDPEEHLAASKARSAALAEIRKVCIPTPFGLLCPVDRESELDLALASALVIQNKHNATASYTRVELFILKGRVAADDEQAARAVAAEMRSLIDRMSVGVEALDPDAIRAAATSAKQLSEMLAPSQKAAAQAAVEEARQAAREIVKRVQKGGEAAAVVLEGLNTTSISQARMAFLDLDDLVPVPAGATPVVALQRFDSLMDEE